MSQDKQYCLKCRFWQDRHSGTKSADEEGYCRRYPPAIIPQYSLYPDITVKPEHGYQPAVFCLNLSDEDSILAAYPITLCHEWCGEYQPA